jgi:hypothetical protein
MVDKLLYRRITLTILSLDVTTGAAELRARRRATVGVAQRVARHDRRAA